jgi:hypothetical protein
MSTSKYAETSQHPETSAPDLPTISKIIQRAPAASVGGNWITNIISSARGPEKRKCGRSVARFSSGLLGGVVTVLWLAACTPTPLPPPNFAITVRTTPINSGEFEIIINGMGFTPGGAVSVTYVNVPNRSGSITGSGFVPGGSVQGDGSVVYQEALNCTSNDQADAQTMVLVNMIDQTTGNFTSQNISGAPWVCPQ